MALLLYSLSWALSSNRELTNTDKLASYPHLCHSIPLAFMWFWGSELRSSSLHSKGLTLRHLLSSGSSSKLLCLVTVIVYYPSFVLSNPSNLTIPTKNCPAVTDNRTNCCWVYYSDHVSYGPSHRALPTRWVGRCRGMQYIWLYLGFLPFYW